MRHASDVQTVSISSDLQPTDGLLKRLLWPRITNQHDADLVGQQGFWICCVVGFAWIVGSFFTAYSFLGVLIGAVYFLGAMGIREHSVRAAVLMFFCLFFDRVASLEALLLGVQGGGNPRYGILATVLLLLNIRATALAHRWTSKRKASEMNENLEMPVPLVDKLANQLPRVLWTRVRYAFYPLAAIIVLSSITAMFWLPQMKQRQQAEDSPHELMMVDAAR